MGLFKFLKPSASSSASIKSGRTERDRDRDGDQATSRIPSSPTPSSTSTFSHSRDPAFAGAAHTSRPQISSRFASLPNTSARGVKEEGNHLAPPGATSGSNGGPPVPPPKPLSQMRSQSSLGIGPSQSQQRERTISTASSNVTTSSFMSKLIPSASSSSGSAKDLPSRNSGFKAVSYGSTRAGKAPMTSGESSPSMANPSTAVTAMREKVEREWERKSIDMSRIGGGLDMGSTSDRTLMEIEGGRSTPQPQTRDPLTEYRIPSLHLDEEESIGWGMGILGNQPSPAEDSEPNMPRQRVLSGGLRMRLDSVAERDEAKQLTGMKPPIRGEVASAGSRREGGLHGDVDEGDEDDRPLGSFAKQLRSSASSSAVPTISSLSASSEDHVPANKVNQDLVERSWPQPAASAPNPLPPVPTASVLSGSIGEPKKSSFFSRRSSKPDIGREGRAGAAQPSVDLQLDVSNRSTVFRTDGWEALSEPTSPLMSPRTRSGPGHKRNGSEGTLTGPPSAWRKGSSSPPAGPVVSSSGSGGGGGFPWRSSSKNREPASTPAAALPAPTSPTSSIYRSPSLSKSNPSLLLGGFMKGKGKGKAKDKKDASLPMLDGEDPSFQLRSFRHISSAAESPPWGTYTGLETESPSAEVAPFPIAVSPAAQSSQSSPNLSAWQGLPTSRRGSTYSLGEDGSPKQISAVAFKQKRTSSSQSIPGQADSRLPRSEHALGTMAAPAHSVHDTQEILISPTKKAPMEVGPPRPSSALSDMTAMPRMPRSHSASAVETLSSASCSTLREVAPVLDPAGKPTNRGFVVSSRRTVSVSSTATGFSGFTATNTLLPNGRPSSALGSYQSTRDTADKTHSPPMGDLPPRPASVFDRSPEADPFPAPGYPPSLEERSTTPGDGQEAAVKPGQETVASTSSGSQRMDTRPPLAERLAQAASASRAAHESTHKVASTGRETAPSSKLNPTALDQPALMRDPDTAPRTGSAPSSPFGKAKAGSWDLSSSEEDEKGPGSRKRNAVKVPQKPRTESMPSGIRKPPAPSVAFGEPRKAVGYVPLKQPAEEAPRPALAQVRQSSMQSVVTRNKAARLLSDDSDEESEESSSDESESLASLRQRRSNSSLGSESRGGSTKTATQSGRGLPGTAATPSRLGPSKLREASPAPPRAPDRSRSTPSVFTQRAPLLPPLVTEKPPSAPFLSASRSRHSPASSATGDTSSSGLPVTPFDLNSSSSDIAVASTPRPSPGDRARSVDAIDGRRSRRVSFMDDGKAEETADIGKDEKKRNERRRGEAKAAQQLGDAFSGGTIVGDNSFQTMGIYNPYGPGGAAQMNQQVADQQAQMYAMQMAQMNAAYQMNPAYLQMQMHQQAVAYAKYQYQMSLANAAMQAANEEWERASNMSGFHPTAPGGGQGGPIGDAYSPGMGSAHRPSSLYAQSAYGGSTGDLLSQRGQFSSSASASGGMRGTSGYEVSGPSAKFPRTQSSSRLAKTSDGPLQEAVTSPRRQRMSSGQATRDMHK